MRGFRGWVALSVIIVPGAACSALKQVLLKYNRRSFGSALCRGCLLGNVVPHTLGPHKAAAELSVAGLLGDQLEELAQAVGCHVNELARHVISPTTGLLADSVRYAIGAAVRPCVLCLRPLRQRQRQQQQQNTLRSQIPSSIGPVCFHCNSVLEGKAMRGFDLYRRYLGD